MNRVAGLGLAVLTALAVPVQAEPLIGPDLGQMEPRPEDLQVFDNRMRMAARIVFDGGDTLAHRVDRVMRLRLEMGFITSAGVPAEDVLLQCRYFFVGPDNQVSQEVASKVCHKGNLGDVAGEWVPMQADLVFRPEAQDARGTWGVRVEVRDDISGAEASFMPTYGWAGGTP